MSHTSKATKEARSLPTPLTSKNMHNNNTTVKSNPTIVILNEYDEINHRHVDKESYTNTDNFKELLLSIIQHETNKLNDEWLKVEAKRVVGTNSVADYMKTIKDNIFFGMTDSDTTTLAMKPSTTIQYNIESNTEATLSTSKTNNSGDLDITETSLLDHESKASIENKNKTTAAPLVVTNGFLNRLLKKIGSMKTPGINKNQKAATQTHPARSIEENESSTNENSSARSHVDHTTSGFKIIVTQEKKLANEAEVSPADMENEIRNETSKEACDTQWNPKKLCDVCVTYHKILNLYHKLDHKNFENLAKNITCFKFMEAPGYFIVKPTKKQDESVTVASKSRRWDWIRNKRSLRSHFDYKHHSFNNIHKAEPNYAEFYEQNSNLDEANKYAKEYSTDRKSRTKNNDIEYEEFDKYDRDKYGIYRLRKKRRKRTADRKPLDLGLDNLHPLKPALNEIYAITGDSIAMDCVTSKYSSQFATNRNQPSNLDNIFWAADTKDILEQDNVVVDGLTVSIGNVQPRNVGNYICRIGNRIQRSVRLSVFTLPSFIVISTPTYSSNSDCSSDDLRAVQNLGAEISNVVCHDDHCTVRIEEPTCLKDKGTEQSKMKAAIVMKVDPHPEINCSVQCRRDLHSSLAKLHAANAAILSDIGVVLLDEGGNKTYVPSKGIGRPVITHRLRRKGINRRPYQKLISETRSDVSIVESCPAGYYLVTEQMICAPCPHNTRSLEGENTCSVCPLGSRSSSGADKCRLVVSRLRRYDWWWYPPCGYCVACSGVVCGCGACVALALIVHVTSRNSASTCAPQSDGKGKPKGRRACTTAQARAFSPRSRPLSPSRVILARFFKPSLSSARATDSQEMKFEQWKERNIPPPLPPIDFDM